MDLHITGDPAADELLSDSSLALLLGMLLDQQVTMESAFGGPVRSVSGHASDRTLCRLSGE